jgi:hypothetical protein
MAPRERLASSCPAHRLDHDVEVLASFCQGAALACGTGANPRQSVDPTSTRSISPNPSRESCVDDLCQRCDSAGNLLAVRERLFQHIPYDNKLMMSILEPLIALLLEQLQLK